MTPKLTPIEALRRCVAEGSFELDGEKYHLDGPQMCDDEDYMWAVCVIGDEEYVPEGDILEQVTEKSEWHRVYC